MTLTRRTFLHGTAASAAAALLPASSYARVIGANDTINLGVAGLNGRGHSHTDAFGKMPNVRITYLIDPHEGTYKKHLDKLAKNGGPAPTTVKDVRKALEDKNLDAVTVATPNHWHSLITFWACQAGKDVYVEKPCSHNIYEGRAIVQAARKNNRIVQHGTQSRGSTQWDTYAEIARSGKLGKLLVSRALCYKDGGTGGSTRGNIGTKPTKMPPAEIDFNLWLGPAAETAYHENLVHYRWHWFWEFGNGDIGNQGVHQMDIARWVIPGAKWPKSVLSLGGRFTGPDQGETPNGMVTVMDFDGTLLIFETRGQPSKPYYGQGVGNVLHFEAGTIAGGKFYPKGKDKAEDLPKLGVEPTRKRGEHFANFIACMRSRKAEELNADVEVGHYSSGLCHLANISYRTGKDEPFNAKTQAVAGNEFATDALGRMAEYLRENKVQLDGTRLHVGRKLEFDAETETFKNDPEANKLLTRQYRAPFVVTQTA